MDYTVFKNKVVEWVIDTVVINAYPPSVGRWLVAFGLSKKLSDKMDGATEFIPLTPEGAVDLPMLKEMVANAFRAQPTVPFTLPEILIDRSTGKTVEPTVDFSIDDANALIRYIEGTTTTKEISL